jgi:FkbM family methyltransferase
LHPSLEKYIRLNHPFLYKQLLSFYVRFLDFDTFLLDRDLKLTIDKLLKSPPPPELSKKTLTFLQVGSNNGGWGDPIKKNIVDRYSKESIKVVGVLIEPVPYLFENLITSYSNVPNVFFENIAIDTKAGTRVFYQISQRAKSELEDKIPIWWDQIGSFDKDHINKHLSGILSSYIEEIEVPTQPLSLVIEKYGFRNVDLLHIDTEGHDLIVLESMGLSENKPSVILIEHAHLNSEDREYLANLLPEHGYKLRWFKKDCLATRR